MNPFKSYLKKTKKLAVVLFPTALMTACATLNEAEVKDYTTINNGYSPNEAAIKKQFKTDHNIKPDDLFKFYCKDGKQIRPLSTKITAIIPAVKKGLNIGTTEGLEKEALSKIRDVIKKQYSPGRWFAPRPGYAGGVYYYAVEFNRREDIVQNLKRPILSEKLFKKDMSLRSPSTTLISLGDGEPLLLGIQSVPEFMYGTANNYHEWGVRSHGDFFGEITKEPKKQNYEPLSSSHDPDRVIFSGKNYGDFFPIKPTVSLETASFSHFYTMLIPKNVFLRVFKIYDERDPSYFYKDDGTFDLDKATRPYSYRMGALWNKYIETFTSTKEAQTTDPQVVNFEVSLDLNMFCAYGRPIDDLKTK